MKGIPMSCRSCGRPREIYEYASRCRCGSGGGAKPGWAVVELAPAARPGSAEDYAKQAKRVGHRPFAGYTNHRGSRLAN